MLYTDHSALLEVLKSEDATGRISRWQLALSEYDLDTFHIPGKDLAVADGLLRMAGYPSLSASNDESTVASFMVDTHMQPATTTISTANHNSETTPTTNTYNPSSETRHMFCP